MKVYLIYVPFPAQPYPPSSLYPRQYVLLQPAYPPMISQPSLTKMSPYNSEIIEVADCVILDKILKN
jgi:hypothetical protein